MSDDVLSVICVNEAVLSAICVSDVLSVICMDEAGDLQEFHRHVGKMSFNGICYVI